LKDIRPIQYDSTYRSAWDAIVATSRNGTFLHRRDFIEYHAHRYDECSLMFFDGENPTAVFPATMHDGTIISHGGLTFGGLVYGMGVKGADVLGMIEKSAEFYRKAGAERIIYKAVPYIFHSYPAQDDLYALFRMNATLARRDISSAMALECRPKLSKGRKYMIKKATKVGCVCREGNFVSEFHLLLSSVLQRHDACPVHSVDELAYLQKKFPDNISLVGAFLNDKLLAATWLFRFGNVLHTQYLANSNEGRELGALDFLIDHVIQNAGPQIEMINFGISTEENGRQLNEGLLFQKEGFGARGIVYDQYEVLL